MRFFYIIKAVILLFAVSCNGSSESSGSRDQSRDQTGESQKVPAASLVDISEPADGDRFSSGEEIKMVLGLRGEDMPDSVKVYFDGKALATLKGGVLEYTVETASARLGSIPLKVMAWKDDKRAQVLTHFVTIVSDIEPELYAYRIINMYPHDRKAYTQGLFYKDGFFYESTGGEGESTLRKVEVETGRVLKLHNLERKFFAEGLAEHNGRLFQLTWKNNVGFVYDMESFEEIKRIHYTTQGWGLASHGEELIMSDGTNKIYFMEPEYFTVLSAIEVYDNKDHVWQLNELEYIRGELWANIYMTDRIARIDPLTGKVLAYIDLSGILPAEDKHSELAELNGIAWDEENERLFVTGKNWPRLFEIELVRRQ